MKRIVIENSNYGLLLSFLILEDFKNAKYILGDYYSENSSLVLNMRKLGIEVEISNYHSMKESGFFKYYFRRVRDVFFEFGKRENIEVYGNDNLEISIPYRKYGMKLIEDGTINYSFFHGMKKRKTLKNKMKDILRIVPSEKKSFGLDERVEKIYLTGLMEIPREIEKKVEIINMKNLWEGKSEEERENILEIFDFNRDVLEKLKGRDIILFTQPVSEDCDFDELEKVTIYEEILKNYPKERVVIKTHPREKTKYRDFFPDYLVLDKPFPFELLNLLGVKFKKSVTLFSTAALGLGEDVEVDFYGTRVHPEIEKKFGSCDIDELKK
ncbi:Glycosyltransferase family 52 [Cetobacterium ceti]|uniref:Glycosyltransferase family 52 n=1 Tax=Cetobacterium ceti TaxID=180163 RepID=A0A1T4LU50_9FUSO|nr:glycosyltransferase family 52 [Cetobacterium ceti]SJZ58269.1 Glycosyltransferase family 52 [Cetobacterium ceti]